ncbi:hypothetical protein [Sphingomonas oleivorans]|nr:hypothetical protein [Sphingomonas oleivorans]
METMMQQDIDVALGALAAEPVHPGLAAGEEALLARIAASRGDASGTNMTRSVAIAAAMALCLGLAGGILPQSPAQAQADLWPFGHAMPLAPSDLLGGGE